MLRTDTKKAISICMAMNIPFFIYAFPGKREYAFYANPSSPDESKARFDGTKEFVVSYFNDDYPYTIGIQPEMDERELLDKLSKLKFMSDAEISPWLCETQKLQYNSQVYQIVQALKRNGGKTVLSRVLTLNCCIDWPNVIDRYFVKCKNAFRYVYFTRETGCWLGATPETLIETTHADNTFKTMSLAGTRQYMDNDSEWDVKNMQEHDYVTDFIVDTLRGMGINPQVHAAENVRFGNIEHLCHRITGMLGNVNIKDLITNLSPTPAVSGYPRNKALSDIARYEVHPRYCYAGNVGVCDENGYHIYVNLRCVHFNEERCCLYTGGGLTAMSNADDEWSETDAKMSVLLESIAHNLAK